MILITTFNDNHAYITSQGYVYFVYQSLFLTAEALQSADNRKRVILRPVCYSKVDPMKKDITREHLKIPFYQDMLDNESSPHEKLQTSVIVIIGDDVLVNKALQIQQAGGRHRFFITHDVDEEIISAKNNLTEGHIVVLGVPEKCT